MNRKIALLFPSKRTLSLYWSRPLQFLFKIYTSLYKNYKRVVRNDLLSAINKQLLFEREQLLLLSEKYLFENNPN